MKLGVTEESYTGIVYLGCACVRRGGGGAGVCVCVFVCGYVCVCVCVRVCVCVPVDMVTELLCLAGEGSVASSLGTGIAERSGFQSGFRFLYAC